ncbi:MAG: ABC transporter ATP-binding protein [Schleiferiaceae bacterium]|nr:ABC transporter ATP-binding protein [Schleiferiaceae bacterium]
MITLEAVSLNIGQKMLLNNVNASIPRASFTAILGNNGAGKSTLLNILTGENQRYTGLYYFDGEHAKTLSVNHWAARRAVLPQMHLQSAEYTGEEVIRMGALPFVATPYTLSKHLEEISTALGIHEIMKQSILHVSGGELQKIHLARVLLQAFLSPVQPPYIFLDEPANHLDLKAQQEIFNYLKKLTHKGFGIVAVIHDINLAARFADHFILLKNGGVVKQGSSQHCLCEVSLSQTFDCPMQRVNSEGLQCPLFIPQTALETSI